MTLIGGIHAQVVKLVKAWPVRLGGADASLFSAAFEPAGAPPAGLQGSA
jgi:hypothetical protein